jgi:hypothetical protein
MVVGTEGGADAKLTGRWRLKSKMDQNMDNPLIRLRFVP